MKKMDEIMELLTEEIEGFNRSIGKLEDLSKKWDNLKIKVDYSSIDYYVKDFLRQQEKILNSCKKSTVETNRTIKSATLVPRWLIKLCCIATGAFLLTLGYFGYHFVRFEENMEEASEKGREEAISELRGYFSDHPIIYKDFQKWAKKKDSVSRQE
ncbi:MULTISPECIES: DUF6730 family protein [Flavobacteriaceae]|uniref:DUF6730 family protein n=1 Tax=Flavobacteriaceae TaxID=49546 RepID=UPI0014912CAA|nr:MULTISPECIES: DUF6730 family protein [Allomuricauda]MDC6364866.1 hypothetical protein [Muricauda sp. AC10]